MAVDHERNRELLLAEIRAEARATARYTGRETFSERVMAALRDVPRQEFVPGDLAASAWANRPLPIGLGQTISQPYIVALMTDLIEPAPEHAVLEIGTGSGYQAAVLARLVRRVYTVELRPELAAQAEQRLHRLGYDNVEVRCGEGRQGWAEHSPYDAILVAAAPERVPEQLLRQLKPGGVLVIPVGPAHGAQELLSLRVDAEGRVIRREILPVAFVPLTGKD